MESSHACYDGPVHLGHSSLSYCQWLGPQWVQLGQTTGLRVWIQAPPVVLSRQLSANCQAGFEISSSFFEILELHGPGCVAASDLACLINVDFKYV